jgi:hypothetical protein
MRRRAHPGGWVFASANSSSTERIVQIGATRRERPDRVLDEVGFERDFTDPLLTVPELSRRFGVGLYLLSRALHAGDLISNVELLDMVPS